MKNSKKIFLILILVLALIFVSVSLVYLKEKKKALEIKKQNFLVTEFSAKGGKEEILPVAIMIDNYPGLKEEGTCEAKIIYEAPAEGEIMRFLAIFDLEDLPEKIGPIRSVRSYFIELAEDYQGFLVHAGGSPETKTILKKKNNLVYNLDEISADGIYFWRDKESEPPFNLFTNKSLIKKAIQDKNLKIKENKNFLYEKDEFLKNGVNLIEIKSRQPIIWKFSQEKKSYFRFKEKSKEPFETQNLVILKTEMKVIDEIGRLKIRLKGEGEAFIFKNGGIIKGVWTRDEQTPLKFYNLEKQEIKFLPGKIWIKIVNHGVKISF